jgi:hypothetical protein
MTTRGDRRLSQIGIDRLVRLKWLEKTASLCLADNDSESIQAILKTDLKEHFRTDEATVRGSIDKTITVLLKVWIRGPSELQPLRTAGLNLLKQLPKKDHVAVHWGMIMAAYPFWGAVALQVGRLLKLQGSAAAAHIQRRLRENYGERETVSRRVRYVLRSYVDWGVLSETGANGVYGSGLSLAIDDPPLVAWLMEASLHMRADGSAPLKDLIASPCLFPFRLRPIHADGLMAICPRIELLRHGLDEELVMLRPQPVTSNGQRSMLSPPSPR